MPEGAVELSAPPAASRDAGIVAVCRPSTRAERQAQFDACLALSGVARVLAATSPGAKGPGLALEVERALAAGAEQVLIATDAFEAPANLLERARAWMNGDPRLGVTCFLANEAGSLSLDVDPAASVDEINERLAAIGADRRPVPIAATEGCLFLIGRSALMAADGLAPDLDSDPYLSVCEFALRASRRGFHTMLDGQAFVRRAGEAGERSLKSDEVLRRRLNAEHPFFPALYDLQASTPSEPLGEALALARAAGRGLRLAIDISAVTDRSIEASEQVTALVRAMTANAKVSWLGLVTDQAESELAGLASAAKIEVVPADIEALQRRDIDVLHVPSTIASTKPWWTWRPAARRTVITLDHAPSTAARTSLAADLIIAAGDGMVAQLRQARAPFPLERVVVIPPVAPRQVAARVPASVNERGWVAERFALCVTSQMNSGPVLAAQKIQGALVENRPGLRLIVIDEDALLPARRADPHPDARSRDNTLLLAPQLSHAERTWLLSHAEFVLIDPKLAGQAWLSEARAPVFPLEPALDASHILAAISDPAVARRLSGAAAGATLSPEPTSLYPVYLDALARPPRRI